MLPHLSDENGSYRRSESALQPSASSGSWWRSWGSFPPSPACDPTPSECDLQTGCCGCLGWSQDRWDARTPEGSSDTWLDLKNSRYIILKWNMTPFMRFNKTSWQASDDKSWDLRRVAPGRVELTYPLMVWNWPGVFFGLSIRPTSRYQLLLSSKTANRRTNSGTVRRLSSVRTPERAHHDQPTLNV